MLIVILVKKLIIKIFLIFTSIEIVVICLVFRLSLKFRLLKQLFHTSKHQSINTFLFELFSNNWKIFEFFSSHRFVIYWSKVTLYVLFWERSINFPFRNKLFTSVGRCFDSCFQTKNSVLCTSFIMISCTFMINSNFLITNKNTKNSVMKVLSYKFR